MKNSIKREISRELRGGNKLKCPHPKCERIIKHDQVCCGIHWRYVPDEIRRLIFENGPGVISDRGRERLINYFNKEA